MEAQCTLLVGAQVSSTSQVFTRHGTIVSAPVWHRASAGILPAEQVWERLPTDPSPFLRLNCYNPGVSLQKTPIYHPPAVVPKPGYLLE